MFAPILDTAQLKQAIDLRDLAGRYTELRRASGDRELCGSCPKCGGDDRFHCTADWFFCRQCQPERRDVIEFVQWMGLAHGFREAMTLLHGQPLPSAAQAPTPKRAEPQHAGWKQRVTTIVERAHGRLFDEDDGQATAGRDYLLGRGIEPHTWLTFRLGVAGAALPGTGGKAKQAAIVIPWTAGGHVVAVRYRFLHPHQGHKQTALYGSQFGGHLYGGQGLSRCAESLHTLVLCEGEINAMSIWQIAQETGLDVLSIGSESQRLTSAMIDYALRFQHVIVWADRPAVARNLMAVLPGAYGVSSPNRQDANDLLRAGHLGGFLSKWRFGIVADDAHGQEALLWNLWDADQAPAGLDAGSRQVMAAIAERLGKHLN